MITTPDPDLNSAFFTPFLIDYKEEKGVQSNQPITSSGIVRDKVVTARNQK